MMARFAEVFEVWNTVVGFLGSHVDVFAGAVAGALFVRVATGVFPRGIRHVFGDCGLPAGVILRATVKCWRSRADQRLFFEFMLVRSLGATLPRRRWRELFDDFCVFLAQDPGAGGRVIPLGNCTHLTEPAFSDAVGRYFAFLAGKPASSAYSVGRFDDFWHSRLRLSEAYVTPAVLLSGLMSRYDSDWSRFLGRYQDVLLHADRDGVSKDEIYGVFSWMLWGPSLEVPWRDGWDGLCMASYGDENNSIPMFANPGGGAAAALIRSFGASADAGGFGALFELDLELVPKARFFDDNRLSLDVRTAGFADRIEKDVALSFLPRVERAEPAPPRAAANCYSTAYLWLLFGRDDPYGAFRPERSVAFFEHANIADPGIASFLRDRLFDKAFAHFRRVAANPARADRRYRFECATNEALAVDFRKRFEAEAAAETPLAAWLRDHMSPEPRHGPETICRLFDEFFAAGGSGLSFVDVDPEDKRDLADLSLFRVTSYAAAFPDRDEAESLENLVRYLQESRRTREWEFHVLLAKNDSGAVVGGAVFDLFLDSGSVFVEFLCVDENARLRRIGTRLWTRVLDMADAFAHRHRMPPFRIFCEVESPAKCRDPKTPHLVFWRKQRFRRLGFDYVQPPLSASGKSVSGLWLIALDRASGTEPSLASSDVEAAVRDYVYHAMGIPAPDENPEFATMRDTLRGLPFVPLSGF